MTYLYRIQGKGHIKTNENKITTRKLYKYGETKYIFQTDKIIQFWVLSKRPGIAPDRVLEILSGLRDHLAANGIDADLQLTQYEFRNQRGEVSLQSQILSIARGLTKNQVMQLIIDSRSRVLAEINNLIREGKLYMIKTGDRHYLEVAS